MTLDSRKVMKEGWLTLFKSRKTGIFNSKPAPNKQLDRGWAVIHNVTNPSKMPSICFFVDNRKEKSVMKREKIELSTVRGVSRMFNHPKHPYCFVLKLKGSKQLILNSDSAHDLELWLKLVCEITRLEYKREKVIWEYYDGGLWNALPDQDSFQIEHSYCEGVTSFQLEDAQTAYGYNLNNFTRMHLRTRAVHRIKRTPFTEDRPEVYHSKMSDLQALWEWGEEDKDLWHTFERETNIQIEDMYDSGSQWAELTLCMPSPMPFLLDLHDMKLVNFRTAVRFNLRRIDNSENYTSGTMYPQARSPSPDDFEQPPQPNMMSPMSPLFRPLQDCLKHLQVPRANITLKNALGEGAFGEVFLALVSGLPGYGDQVGEVAVKQLRLSDFIARHGHHTQQMEDFLREAKEMSKVDNHRVVKLIAVCTLDYPLLLIEEYMDQGDLLGVLKDSRPSMPLLTQLTFAHHVAQGMEYIADTLNTVHRDLAARNILVHRNQDGTMEAKVADFGLSRHLYSEMYKTQGSKPRPLPAKWMALESLMYFIFTSKSDVWSYGVMLWEIMTLGRTPYPGVENRELLEQIEEKGLKLTHPKPCPAALYDIILDCTRHEPDDRPTFSDLRKKLDDCLKQLEKGELVSSSENTSPTSTATEGASSSSPGKEGGCVSPSQGGGRVEGEGGGEGVDGADGKEKKKEEEEEEEEFIAGHLYSIVNKVRKPRSNAVASDDKKAKEDSPPSSPQATPTASSAAEEDLTTESDSRPATKKVSHQEMTETGETGHLYYLLDPKEDDSSSSHRRHHQRGPSPPRVPPSTRGPSPPRVPPSTRSPAHTSSSSILPNNNSNSNHKPSSNSNSSSTTASPAHQSDKNNEIIHSSPVMTSHPRANTHTGGVPNIKSTGGSGGGKASRFKKTGSLGRHQELSTSKRGELS